MEAKDIKWCPQHGYPLPCYKCGMPLSQLEEVSNNAAYRKNLPYLTSGQSYIKRIAQAQAEISFKAGHKHALEGAVIEGGYESVKKAGIREVVESLKKPCPHSYDCISQVNIGSCAICWQAQLKDWGIDED